MSSNQETQPDAPAKKSKLPLIAAIAVGLSAGAGGGAFLVGPLLAKKAETPTAAADSAHAPAEKGHGEEQGGHGPAATFYTIDNLVLNPAGTGGTRFLMVTLAIGTTGEEMQTAMRGRDAEVRDAVLRVLQTKTVEQLADVSGREAIRTELFTAITKLFPKGAVTSVFLPQFVIQ